MSAAGGRIDWDEVRRQVERAAVAAQGRDEDDATAAGLLRARAAALAAQPLPEGDQRAEDDSLEVLAFEIAGERYGFAGEWVARVIPMQPLTALPGLPASIVGITAFEGEVLAVLDLRSLLALPLARLAEPSALVVLRAEGRECAVLAEGIAGVRHFRRAALEASSPTLAGIAGRYLHGIAPDRTAVLDARRLLTDSRLVVHADRN